MALRSCAMAAACMVALCTVAATASIVNPLTVDTAGMAMYYVTMGAPGETWAVRGSDTPVTANETVYATVWYNASMTSIGWDWIQVAPNSTLFGDQRTALTAYYAAGFGEGFVNGASIYNYKPKGQFAKLTEGQQKWIEDNYNFTMDSIEKNPRSSYWMQVQKQYEQLDGITDGYNLFLATSGKYLEQCSLWDVLALNLGDEVGDIQSYVDVMAADKAGRDVSTLPVDALKKQRHCSALIKITGDDLFVAHDTWSSFESMRRVFKVYVFEVSVGFSGYPAQTASGDDWYMTSTGLAVQETTNDVFNMSLFRAAKPQTVTEYIRVMVATFLATDAKTWVDLFSMHNSGTYNNQYMAVDMNKFVPGMPLSTLADDLLWVVEQVPGLMVSADKTDVLRETGYWASFNVAYFPEIYDISGYPEKLRTQGTFWSYTKYARPEIFKRQQSTVTDLASMQAMMRYNEFKTDPFSVIPAEVCRACVNATCNPESSAMLTIASRGDLNPSATIPGICYGQSDVSSFVDQRDHCATDAKIAMWSQMRRGGLVGSIISGPTRGTGELPVFQFTKSPFAKFQAGPPAGIPDVMDFTWVATGIPAPAPEPQSASTSPSSPLTASSSGYPMFSVSRLKTDASRTAFVKYQPGSVSVPADEEIVATVTYGAMMHTMGWDWLQVTPDASLLAQNASEAYYFAGYGEGFVSAASIYNYKPKGQFAKLTLGQRNWIKDNYDFAMENIAQAKADKKAGKDTTMPSLGWDVSAYTYWMQVEKQYKQLDGITDGYNQRQKEFGLEQCSLWDILALNLGDEVGDIQSYVDVMAADKAGRDVSTLPVDALKKQRHCSALIKITGDDLFVAHDTWSSFESMRRVFKIYSFEVNVGFSGYPAQTASGDDWYMTSTGLAVQETTNDVFNMSLFRAAKPQTVTEYIRVMVATFLARDAKQWQALFRLHNSGTYNNQYMAVNMNLYDKGMSLGDLPADLLWVSEQVPGLIVAADKTDVLRATGYWASFNVAYFPEIYDISGYPEKLRTQGTFWSYTKYARPEIFKRQQSTVTDLASMQAMMRYNEFKTDPFSLIPDEVCRTCPNAKCTPNVSAMLTIASRGDLNPAASAPGICYGQSDVSSFVDQRDHCATDAKIAMWSQMRRGGLVGSIISGPTRGTGELPVFQFTKSPFAKFQAGPPAGIPDVMDFTWVATGIPNGPWPYSALPSAAPIILGVFFGALFGFIIGFLMVKFAPVIRAKLGITMDDDAASVHSMSPMDDNTVGQPLMKESALNTSVARTAADTRA